MLLSLYLAIYLSVNFIRIDSNGYSSKNGVRNLEKSDGKTHTWTRCKTKRRQRIDWESHRILRTRRRTYRKQAPVFGHPERNAYGVGHPHTPGKSPAYGAG